VHEKRHHPRVAVHLPLVCHPAEGEAFPAIAVDLSVGGVYVEAEFVPAFGAELVLVGDFPGAARLRLPSIVRWVKPGGFGVQFGLLGAKETHALGVLMQQSRH
jgi:hypothetical protein